MRRFLIAKQSATPAEESPSTEAVSNAESAKATTAPTIKEGMEDTVVDPNGGEGVANALNKDEAMEDEVMKADAASEKKAEESPEYKPMIEELSTLAVSGDLSAEKQQAEDEKQKVDEEKKQVENETMVEEETEKKDDEEAAAGPGNEEEK